MKVYLNMKSPNGVETVDEFTQGEEGNSEKFTEFRQYINQMKNEYKRAGMNVYESSRPTDEWEKR